MTTDNDRIYELFLDEESNKPITIRVIIDPDADALTITLKNQDSFSIAMIKQINDQWARISTIEQKTRISEKESTEYDEIVDWLLKTLVDEMPDEVATSEHFTRSKKSLVIGTFFIEMNRRRATDAENLIRTQLPASFDSTAEQQESNGTTPQLQSSAV